MPTLQRPLTLGESEVAMGYVFATGRMLFATAVTGFGLQCLIFSKFVSGIEPVSATLVSPIPWAWATGVVLLASGLSVLTDRYARTGAMVLAVFFLLAVGVLHAPLLIINLKNQADDALHTLAIGASALVLAAGAKPIWGPDRLLDRQIERLGALGQLCFGLCVVGFGVMHFVFFKFTADFIPAWIPQHAFWAGATGVAQIAAGLAVLSGVLARLGAALAGVMYGSWALIVHLPRIAARPTSHVEWSDLATVVALCAGALLVARAVGAVSPRWEACEE